MNFGLAKVPWYYDERWHQRAMSARMLLGQLGLHRMVVKQQGSRIKDIYSSIEECSPCEPRISSSTFLANSSLWSCMPRLRRYREIHPLQRRLKGEMDRLNTGSKVSKSSDFKYIYIYTCLQCAMHLGMNSGQFLQLSWADAPCHSDEICAAPC